MTGLALEELDEVGGIVVAELEGDLLDHHVGVAHHALGLEDDAVVDEGERGLLRTLVDAILDVDTFDARHFRENPFSK